MLIKTHYLALVLGYIIEIIRKPLLDRRQKPKNYNTMINATCKDFPTPKIEGKNNEL